ncbi:MAG: hypothetical protein Q4F79_00135 [Eubacteriales bacterium]|nr:hypothetical protein [Eubacteriales bacterium]
MAKKYMLISVCDREIMTEQFDTKEEAQESMRKEMIEWGKVSEEIFSEQEYDDGDCGFGEYSAYVNDGANHADLDWLIVAL